MKKFDYIYALLQNGVLTNSDGTNVKKKSSTSGFEVFDNSWDQYLEDAIVPEITYTETNAVSVDKTVKAWTFYCDSLSGCVEGTAHYEDGNGSIENPWRSMVYALRQIQTKLNCWRANLCCYDPYRKGKYFQLKVKGIIDYTIYWQYSEFRGAERVDNQWVHQFIISPWENNSWVYSGNDMHHVYGTVFNRMQVGTGASSNMSNMVYGSEDCIFNHLVIQKGGYFNSCHGTRFIDASATRTTYDSNEGLFVNCIGSDIINFTGNNVRLNGGLEGGIYNASVIISDTSEVEQKYVTGFQSFYNCNFYNCSANVSGTLHCGYYGSGRYAGFVDAVGFYGNSDCTFYNCSATDLCQKCSDDPHICRTPDF